jgi:hypothetical protein
VLGNRRQTFRAQVVALRGAELEAPPESRARKRGEKLVGVSHQVRLQ